MARFTRLLRPAPQPQTPVEALQLQDALTRYTIAIDVIKEISPACVCDNAEDGLMQIKSWLVTLRLAYRYAQNEHRQRYLRVTQ